MTSAPAKETLSNDKLSRVEGVSTPSSFFHQTGISLKSKYFHSILADFPEIGFFEIHAENYLSKGGPARHYLQQIREHYAFTVHGVGLSIGGEMPLDKQHLNRVAQLVNEIKPEVFSEHLAWSTHNNVFLNDLLPVAYDQTTLNRVCEHIDQLQSTLQRRVLIENPSTYFEFTRSDRSEIDFICEMTKRTGCGLLLDVNNVEVSCFNQKTDPYDYLNAFPVHAVGQIHLAGHTLDQNAIIPLKIDSHDEAVCHDVWDLYQHTLMHVGDCPTLIERDGNLPPIAELLTEAHYADEIRAKVRESRHEYTA
ncbi:MNIO family bufferin maturase [Marinomonas transparens]|uniref:DUF692 domain-containing protein n=1 Tax=Marinomonas transparens TaxID=2795388 RepID=A0A934JPN3_9GAMM|nr:DUF692 domain-containing protein [Marinomonas transparens]MBJ7536132.1 DUF692 domain-containing protein [Marinomonas transparens]